MAIIGVNFKKIFAERKSGGKDKISIKNNIGINKIEEANIKAGPKDKALKFTVDYSAKYEPGVAEIALVSEVIMVEESKKAKEILDNWTKKNQIDKSIAAHVLNHVLIKSNIRALSLSEQLSIPPQIELPKVRAEEKQK